MSNVTHTVQVTTRIDAACDVADSKYALSNVLMTPAQHEEVFITATDAKILAIRKETGTGDSEVIVPRDILPKKNHAKPVTLELNGEWRSSENKVAPDDTALLFPKVESSLPPVCLRDYVFVAVDVEQLVALAKALGTSGVGVFIKRQQGTVMREHTTPDTIAVVPMSEKTKAGWTMRDDGIGLLMPLAADDSDAKQAADSFAKFSRSYTEARAVHRKNKTDCNSAAYERFVAKHSIKK